MTILGGLQELKAAKKKITNPHINTLQTYENTYNLVDTHTNSNTHSYTKININNVRYRVTSSVDAHLSFHPQQRHVPAWQDVALHYVNTIINRRAHKDGQRNSLNSPHLPACQVENTNHCADYTWGKN